ncbi:hypothetical protein NPIL_225871 [Nephila pilipes]|uniref:Uncharacterized protein n=1 Tax=Nephila pilipes TaxID=299642 RepID=A0A8X6UQS1_NEPPI|nr:hypothetical protein NPIL_225871 [Nephila pilipes]
MLKASLKSHLLESKSWLEALPFVLLGIRSAIKEDLENNKRYEAKTYPDPWKKTAFVSKQFSNCSHVFLYNNVINSSLQPVYLEPYASKFNLGDPSKQRISIQTKDLKKKKNSGRPCKPSIRGTQWTNRPIEGRVSVDRSKVAALALTTPSPVGESSTDDSPPPHHTSFKEHRGDAVGSTPETAQITEKASSAPSEGT